jgi:hypothetical protein
MDELVRFVRERLAEGIKHAHWSGEILITHAVREMGGSLESAGRYAQLQVVAAEAKQTLFEETVRPYLGTAGPTGRIAEHQLRLLALMYASYHGYREEWRP